MKRLLAIGAAIVALTACSQTASDKPQESLNQNGVSSQIVTLEDGSKVMCVRVYNAGISCDWAGRWE